MPFAYLFRKRCFCYRIIIQNCYLSVQSTKCIKLLSSLSFTITLYFNFKVLQLTLLDFLVLSYVLCFVCTHVRVYIIHSKIYICICTHIIILFSFTLNWVAKLKANKLQQQELKAKTAQMLRQNNHYYTQIYVPKM